MPLRVVRAWVREVAQVHAVVGAMWGEGVCRRVWHFSFPWCPGRLLVAGGHFQLEEATSSWKSLRSPSPAASTWSPAPTSGGGGGGLADDLQPMCELLACTSNEPAFPLTPCRGRCTDR